MKKILVCDGDIRFLKEIADETNFLCGQMQLWTTISLGGLIGTAAQCNALDAVFLNGYLARGETTLPFLRELSEGKFPHLKNTCFYFTSSDIDMCTPQLKFLNDELGVEKWKWTTCKREAVAAEIRRLTALD